MFLVSQGVALEACPRNLKDFDELTKLFLASTNRPKQDWNVSVSAVVAKNLSTVSWFSLGAFCIIALALRSFPPT